VTLLYWAWNQPYAPRADVTGWLHAGKRELKWSGLNAEVMAESSCFWVMKEESVFGRPLWIRAV